MKDLSTGSKTYIFGTVGAGGIVLITQLAQIRWAQGGLLALAVLAALAQTFKVNGPTDRSNYNLAWLVYGFTLVSLGIQACLLVILVAHLAEWVRHRYPWYIQTFNIAVYALAAIAADFIYRLVNPAGTPLEFQGALGLLALIATFTLLNHLLVGWVIRLARGQSLAESGVFDILTLATDFTLLGLGAASAVLFLINPYGAILNIIPVYLLYQALKVPALSRRVHQLETRLDGMGITRD
jgi:hypothetical protein